MDSLFEQIALNAIAERSPRGAILPQSVRAPPWGAPVAPPPSGPPPPGWRPGAGAAGGGASGGAVPGDEDEDEGEALALPGGVDADEEDSDADGFVVFSTRRVRARALRCALCVWPRACRHKGGETLTRRFVALLAQQTAQRAQRRRCRCPARRTGAAPCMPWRCVWR